MGDAGDLCDSSCKDGVEAAAHQRTNTIIAEKWKKDRYYYCETEKSEKDLTAENSA